MVKRGMGWFLLLYDFKYSKILYVDTDILVNSDINVLFKLPISSKQIYALREGHLGPGFGRWFGSNFFESNKVSKYQSAFNSGILLFMNSATMRSLFSDINHHIEVFTKHYVFDPDTMTHDQLRYGDQPFIVYHAISKKKYNNISHYIII